METKLKYMSEALSLAKRARSEGEVPVGAVVVFENRIIGKGYNRREQLQSALAHAEIMAITEASEKLGSWRLENCELYVTLEPCVMCSGAIVQSRIKKVVFGAEDPKGGGVVSLFNLLNDSRLNHRVEVESGIMKSECSTILSDFFREIREKQKLIKQQKSKVDIE